MGPDPAFRADELAARYPRATIIRDVLYVVDGRIATSAGIASGIDLALHLIAVRDGPVIAARVAREMMVYARRNGDEQQASAMLRRQRAHPDSPLRRHGRHDAPAVPAGSPRGTRRAPDRARATVEAAARTVGFADARMLRRLRRRRVSLTA